MSFDEEHEAAFAFGYVYGGDTDREWGAQIKQDPATGLFYIGIIKEGPTLKKDRNGKIIPSDTNGTTIHIPFSPGMTAGVHTHPYPTTSAFSPADRNLLEIKK
jgi:hypothetical protein